MSLLIECTYFSELWVGVYTNFSVLKNSLIIVVLILAIMPSSLNLARAINSDTLRYN